MHSAANHSAAQHYAARHTTLEFTSAVQSLRFLHNAAQHYAARHSRAQHTGRLASNIARPIADVSTGDWLPSAGVILYEMIDEVEADDTSYIYINGAGSCEFLLSPLAAPSILSAHALRYRIRCDQGRTLTVTFRQGSTEIASWLYNPAPVTPQTFTSYLSAAQIGNITDYTDLRVRLTSE